ncbi:hypothetical protein BKA93DRAFT_210705 [Sparassis latifolia]
MVAQAVKFLVNAESRYSNGRALISRIWCDPSLVPSCLPGVCSFVGARSTFSTVYFRQREKFCIAYPDPAAHMKSSRTSNAPQTPGTLRPMRFHQESVSFPVRSSADSPGLLLLFALAPPSKQRRVALPWSATIHHPPSTSSESISVKHGTGTYITRETIVSRWAPFLGVASS